MKAWRFLTFVYFAVLIRRRSEEHTSELQSPCNLVCRIIDRKSTRLNSSHLVISYAVFCLKKKKDKDLETSEAHYQRTTHVSRSDGVGPLGACVTPRCDAVR